MKTITKALMKAMSSIDIDLKKHYKIERIVQNVTHFHYLQNLHKKIDDELLIENHSVPIRIFYPKKETDKMIIFFHGGGWVVGNVETYNKTCTKLSYEMNHILVSVEYRLAPEYPFPNGLEDCYGVTKEIFKRAEEMGIKKENITLMGDSAGGNLAAAVSLLARDKKTFFPQKQILIYPVTYNDHSDKSPFYSVKENGKEWLLTSKKVQEFMELYVTNKKDLDSPYVAPLLAKDLTNQPKTLIITAELDPLRDEGEAYGKKLEEAGNTVEIHRILDVIHGFMNYTIFKKAITESYQYINTFLNGDDKGEEKK